MSIVFTDGVTPLNAANLNPLEQKVNKGVANGYASLDGGGKVPAAQLPTPAIVRFAQVLLGAAAATIDFTAIPATYSGLRLVLLGRGDAVASEISARMTFNGDTGANYDDNYMVNVNTTPSGFSDFAQTAILGHSLPAANATSANQPGIIVIEIPGYAGTVFEKVTVSQLAHQYTLGGGGDRTGLYQGHWRSTAAINRVTLTASAGNFITGTLATLYGLA